MIDWDKWREIFSSLGRHPMRTMLTAFSVWWGMFMLMILLGAASGLENSAKRDFENDAKACLWVWGRTTSIEYKGMPIGRRVNYRNGDLERLRSLEGPKHISGRHWIRGNFNIVYGDKSLSYNTQPVTPEHKFIELPKMVEGRWLNDEDLRSFRKVAVIGKPVREAFFGKEEEAIGKIIKIKEMPFKVVGVFTDARKTEMERLYLPMSVIQKTEGHDHISSFSIDLGDDANMEDAERIENEVRTLLASRHLIDPADKEAIGSWNTIEEAQEVQNVLMSIKILVWTVGIFSIIAGVIGVSNIMLIIVKERTREIGIRKALGATPRSILSMILTEALILTSIAGYIGLAVGLGLVYFVEWVMVSNDVETEFFLNPEVNIWTALGALFTLVIAGLLAGVDSCSASHPD